LGQSHCFETLPMEIFGLEILSHRQLGDNDDGTVAQTTSQQLVNTFVVNIVLFVVLVAIFEFVRRKKTIYLARMVKRFVSTNRVPGKPSLYPLAWISKINEVSEPELLEMVGLDAYMCLRFITVCFRTACFTSFFGLLVLVPIYHNTYGTPLHGWDRCTIRNIPEDPTASRLWAPVFMCYIFAGFFCQLMYIEYKNFVGKRVEYLVKGDFDTPDQTYYTVMVEKVPSALRSGPMLAAFFERLYPGEFHSVELALDLHDLEATCAKRRRVRNKLEKHVALCWATHQRSIVWKRPSTLPDFPRAVVQSRIAQDIGYEIVDAIEYYAKELALLNNSVRSMQKIYFDQRQRLDELEEYRLEQIKRHFDEHTKDLQFKVGEVGSRFAGYLKGGNYQASLNNMDDDDANRDETLSNMIDKRRNSLLPSLSPIMQRFTSPTGNNNKSGAGDSAKNSSSSSNGAEGKKSFKPSAAAIAALRDNDDNEDAGPGVDSVENSSTKSSMSIKLLPVKQTLSDNDLRKSAQQSRDSQRESESNRESRGSNDERMSQAKKVFDQGREMIKNVAKSGMEELTKEGVKTAEFAAKGALRGMLEATRALELLTFGAQYRVSSTAFVTFKSRVAKATSQQTLLSSEYYSMEVKPAPNPRDIVWENVSIPQSQIFLRTSIADGTLIVGALFWSIVVTFIYAISNLETISRAIPSLRKYSNTQVYSFANSYLAILLLLILLAILPFIFDFIARSYEGLKTESEIQNSIMTRYFYYQLANIYVAVGLGSVANSLHSILANPSSLMIILGASVPTYSIFFANLVIIKTFTAVPVEMLRVIPLLDILAVGMCMDKRKCTRRELRTGAFADPPMLYGWIYPNLMMVLMIMLTYCCVSSSSNLFLSFLVLFC
jgi:hypothetical protein